MTHAVVFTPEDFDKFLGRLDEIVDKRLKGYVVEKPMTAKEAASYLRISEWTLWDRVRKGTIPTDLIHRSAGSVYFLASELHQYIKNN